MIYHLMLFHLHIQFFDVMEIFFEKYQDWLRSLLITDSDNLKICSDLTSWKNGFIIKSSSASEDCVFYPVSG